MSQPARKKNRRSTQRVGSFWRAVRLTAIISFVSLAVIAVVFALVESAQPPLGKHTQTAASCTPTLVSTGGQAPPEKWYSINSGSAADILSAAKCTDIYQSALQGNDIIATALHTGMLANPVLVKPYRSDVGLAQYWVVPVVNASNRPLAFLTLFYDPQSQRIQEGEFDAVTGNMFYTSHAFPAITANAAVAAVSAEQHVALAAGQAAELIYFPADVIGIQQGTNHWNGGGTSVIDPIWRVPGADGLWHYVDHNGQSHPSTDIPVDPSYQPMPASTTIQ
ncbi:MAG TPA: hypothetical protein VKT82_29825 [Ktedonobacterales bacterium]|nr:hypothetical protein [Ktedonobacterales bacterium]